MLHQYLPVCAWLIITALRYIQVVSENEYTFAGAEQD